MGSRARRGRSGFRRQRPVGRRVVLAVAVYRPLGDIFFQLRRRYRAIGCQPACRTPDRTLVNARTARSHQAVCRCRLIRLPGDAIGVRRLRAAAQAARAALRGPCCVRLSAWWLNYPLVWLVSCRHPAVCCGALTWPARAATDSTIGKQPTPTRDRAPVSGTDRPAQCPQTRVSLIFDAVVCGSGTPGLHTVVSTATLHGPSSRCRPMG